MVEVEKISWWQTFDSYEPQNESQIKAKIVLETLSKLLLDNWWKLEEPILIWLQSKPWLWKTHLVKAFIESLNNSWIKTVTNQNDEHFLMMGKYKWSQVIVLDDFLKEFQEIKKWSHNTFWEIWSLQLQRFQDFLFYVYENHCVVILTSNFDIKDILTETTKTETQHWRLASRVEHLLANTHPIHIEWDDYRKKIATKWWKYGWLFSDALAQALWK